VVTANFEIVVTRLPRHGGGVKCVEYMRSGELVNVYAYCTVRIHRSKLQRSYAQCVDYTVSLHDPNERRIVDIDRGGRECLATLYLAYPPPILLSQYHT